MALWLTGAPRAAIAQALGDKDFAPGFGLVYGVGQTDNEAENRRFGFTSRRLREDDKVGSLALLGEEHFDGIPFEILDGSLAKDHVEIRYQTVFAEIKRYFPLGGPFHAYWGLRGGYSRIRGRIRQGGGGITEEFKADLIGPLALLALPLAIENPGFLLLALADGTSGGLTLDIVPKRLWLDLQVGAVLIPNFRNTRVVIDERTITTRTLQLVLVF